MKKINSLSKRVAETALSLSDAFVDYMNDNYFPGADEVLDAETINFEYENFVNNYSQVKI